MSEHGPAHGHQPGTRPGLASDLRKFLTVEALDGPLLAGAMILAMICVNSPLEWLYAKLLAVDFEVRLDHFSLAKPLLLWINDGLMAVFFLLIALEIKHEAHEGALSRPSQIVLPAAAAVGGMVVPAAIYWLFNRDDAVGVRGWAIPTATDIAFSLGVLGLLGSRVPRALKAFLMTLAVFDDLGAIIVIAVFYAGKISWTAHFLAAGATLVLFAMNRAKVSRAGPYFVVGTILWVCVLKSGVHATIAGVVLGFAIPYRHRDPARPSPLKQIEHALHPWVALLILPVFAFANAGVSLEGVTLHSLVEPVTVGIGTGLVLGKWIGVFGASALLVRLGVARLPEGANWSSMAGIGLLAGIGFTMSMFIGTLAFEGQNRIYATDMRLGVILGSLVSALLGILLLHLALPRRTDAPPQPPTLGDPS